MNSHDSLLVHREDQVNCIDVQYFFAEFHPCQLLVQEIVIQFVFDESVEAVEDVHS